jgi:hypothetical protein
MKQKRVHASLEIVAILDQITRCAATTSCLEINIETPSPHPDLDALAADLFRYFSRFEYALKATRYLTRDNGDATPDWDGFAVRVEERVSRVDDAEYRAAADYILTHPPKKQVVRDGALDWDDAAPGELPPNQLALLYVRRVRNNLFHGGKFNGRWFAPERSGELLRSSLVILRTSLEAEPNVHQAFAAT